MNHIDLRDCDGIQIQLGDTVDIYGFKGKVCINHGAYGIGFNGIIPWDVFASKIVEETGCDNRPLFCQNDNFISFWELAWNYDCTEDVYNMVKVIKRGE